MRFILSRIRNFFQMPDLPPISRDQDLIRDTSRLRMEQNHLKRRGQANMDRIDDLYRRTLDFAKHSEGGES